MTNSALQNKNINVFDSHTVETSAAFTYTANTFTNNYRLSGGDGIRKNNITTNSKILLMAATSTVNTNGFNTHTLYANTTNLANPTSPGSRTISLDTSMFGGAQSFTVQPNLSFYLYSPASISNFKYTQQATGTGTGASTGGTSAIGCYECLIILEV